MYATDFRSPAQARERGSATLAALMLAITVSALCLLMITSSRVSNERARTRMQGQKAFYVAEGGLDFVLSQVRADQSWPLASTSRFPTLETDGTFVSGWIPLGDSAGEFQVQVNYQSRNSLPTSWNQPGLPDGFELSSNVAVTDRTAALPAYDRIEIAVTGRFGEARRRVRASVRFESRLFRAAIVSDSPPLQNGNGSSSGKTAAIKFGHVSFKPGNQYIYGGIHANSKIISQGVGQVDESELATAFSAYDGDLQQELYGTADEIPDYTSPGSTEQLFDFGRFRAAAAAGAGQVIPGLANFITVVNAANAAGTPLEGIIYVEVDAAVEGNSPKLQMAGGINVLGTLVFDFVNPPDQFYKVFILCPLNVNPATLPGNFDPADPSTHTTGYPPVVSAGKDPRGFAIGSLTYEDFPVDADMPAVMFNTGTVDFHGAANVSGAVYGPSFIEIENKDDNLQYFIGTILGGGGIFLEGNSNPGAAQVFNFDPSSVNTLPTLGDGASSPVIQGYIIGD